MRPIPAGLIVAFAALSARAEDVDLSRVFDTAAKADDARYVLGRDALFAAGDAGVAVAAAHAKDEAPGARALAALVLLRKEMPDEFAVWTEALATPWADVVSREESAIVRFARTGSKGQRLETREVILWAKCAPVVVDAVRASFRLKRAAQVAAAIRCTDAAPWLVRGLAANNEDGPACEEALVAIGPASAPSVRTALADEHPYRVAAAARVLGRVGDRESVPRLAELLASSDWSEVIAAAAEALAALDPARAASVSLDRLVAFDAHTRRRTSDDVSYSHLRRAALAASGALAAEIEKRRGSATTLVSARFAGIAWEIANGAAASAFYARLGSDPVHRRQRLGDLDPAQLVPYGRDAFWRGFRESPDEDEAPLPLVLERAATLGSDRDLGRAIREGGPAGIDLTRAVLIARLRTHDDPGPLVALAEASPDAAFDVFDAYAASADRRGLGSAAEALFLLLGDPRASGVIAKFLPARGDGATLLWAANALLTRTQTVDELLASDKSEVRLAVARAVVRRGDPAGVPVLASAAIDANVSDYVAYRDDFVHGKIVPESSDADVRRRVLHDVIAARIADPAATHAATAARSRRYPVNMTVVGPGQGEFITGGELLAQDLGEAGRVFLEEAALFEGSRVAVHALAALGGDAAVNVLVRVARWNPSDAAVALKRLGEKGLAAARAIPVPDPSSSDFGGRGSRHVAAAEALAASPGGVEKALEGLAEAIPQRGPERSAWAERMRNYLGVLAPAGDPRAVEPALRILAAAGRFEDWLTDAALLAMEKVKDARVVEASVSRLPEPGESGPSDAARRVLAAQLGDGLPAFLRGRLATKPSEGSRAAIALLLASVARTAGERSAAAEVLRDELAAADEDTASWLASRLADLHVRRPEAERDAKDLEALLTFVRTHDHAGAVAERLIELRAPGTAEAFLAGYQRVHGAQHAWALGALKYEPAVPVMRDVLVQRLRDEKKAFQYGSPPEFRELALIGGAGRAFIRSLLGEPNSRTVRVHAAMALTEAKDADAYDAVLAFLDADDRDAAPSPVERINVRRTLLWTMEAFDPARALADAGRRALTSKDEAAAHEYAEVAAGILERHRELAGPK